MDDMKRKKQLRIDQEFPGTEFADEEPKEEPAYSQKIELGNQEFIALSQFLDMGKLKANEFMGLVAPEPSEAKEKVAASSIAGKAMERMLNRHLEESGFQLITQKIIRSKAVNKDGFDGAASLVDRAYNVKRRSAKRRSIEPDAIAIHGPFAFVISYKKLPNKASSSTVKKYSAEIGAISDFIKKNPFELGKLRDRAGRKTDGWAAVKWVVPVLVTNRNLKNGEMRHIDAINHSSSLPFMLGTRAISRMVRSGREGLVPGRMLKSFKISAGRPIKSCCHG